MINSRKHMYINDIAARSQFLPESERLTNRCRQLGGFGSTVHRSIRPEIDLLCIRVRSGGRWLQLESTPSARSSNQSIVPVEPVGERSN